MEASISRKFLKSVEIAIALKSRLATGRCFHVTTIFDKNKLISIGSNNYNKTHPISLKYMKKEIWGNYIPSIHSELSAILKLGEEDCSDYLFFNVRIDKNNQINNSHPCSGCEEMMRQIGFKRLFYSTNIGSFTEYLG
jgi:deoxycytidylate deaminase